jgi:hypothetical protein
MAAPTPGTPTGAAINGGSTTLTVPVPTVSSGDLMIAFGMSGTGGSREITPPGGWTQLVKDNDFTSSTVHDAWVWWKVAGGSEGTDYSFTLSDSFTRARVVIVPIAGAADPAGDAIEYTLGLDNASGGTTTSPAVTPSAADSLILRTVICRDDGLSYTAPGSHTEIYDASSTAMGATVAHRTFGASSTGTADFTYTPTYYAGFWHAVVAVAPTASGSVVPVIFHNQRLH